MTVCKYRNVSERDMDLLFMEAFATDTKFVELFIKQTRFHGKSFEVIHVERSKIDSGLGETDNITLIFDVEGQRHGFLIEDKNDAVAMPDQHERYVKRGRKGIENGEYAVSRI